MIYGQGLYGTNLYEDIAYSATWANSYSFTYEAGTTVIVTPTLSCDCPPGSWVEIWAGETALTMTQLTNGIANPLVFTSTTSGATNLYVKLIFCTISGATNPTVNSIIWLIEQSTSLYTIATQILADGLASANVAWNIDTELTKYLIPYGWVDVMSHREAIGLVAEAAGGVAYQDRYGIVRVEAGNYLQRETSLPSVATITKSKTYKSTSPVSTVKNRIQIQTFPYAEDASQTVWAMNGTTIINNGETKTFDVKYTDWDAVVDGVASITSSPAGATISTETHYSTGAHLVVTGSANGQSITALSITGKPLVVVGAQLVEKTDGGSIRRNGDKTLSIMDNKLIQSATLAEEIAEAIIASTAQEARDVVKEWRGDPTLELGDKVTVDGEDGVIVTQDFTYDGIFSARAQIRKV